VLQELRSDPAFRREKLDFSPALEIWAAVISVPEPTRFVLGAGRRDFGDDSGAPALVRHLRAGIELAHPQRAAARIAAVNDQHAIVGHTAPWDARVGDVIVLSPSHPCTTFDKWRTIHVIDDVASVIETIRTYF
jgi:D-serine dehydratase